MFCPRRAYLPALVVNQKPFMAKQHHPKDCSLPARMVAPLWCASHSADKTHSGGSGGKTVMTVTFRPVEKDFSFVPRQPHDTIIPILNPVRGHMAIRGQSSGIANDSITGRGNSRIALTLQGQPAIQFPCESICAKRHARNVVCRRCSVAKADSHTSPLNDRNPPQDRPDRKTSPRD